VRQALLERCARLIRRKFRISVKNLVNARDRVSGNGAYDRTHKQLRSGIVTRISGPRVLSNCRRNVLTFLNVRQREKILPLKPGRPRLTHYKVYVLH
jgi:SMC interacting uncharacterized protein involved in chromosome segregation